MCTDNRYHDNSGAAMTGGDTVTMLVGSGVTALTLGVAFGLLALDVRWFWVAFPVGFGLVLPAAITMTHARRSSRQQRGVETQPGTASTALEVLKQRYAAGELTDEEFEHRLERLLEGEAYRTHHASRTDTRQT